MKFNFSRACVTGFAVALVAVLASRADAVLTLSMNPANLQIAPGGNGSALVTVTSNDGGGNPLMVNNIDVAMNVIPNAGGSVNIVSFDPSPAAGSIWTSPSQGPTPNLPNPSGYLSSFDFSNLNGFAANGNVFEVVFSAANASAGQTFAVDLNDAGQGGSNAAGPTGNFTSQLVVNPASISVVPEPSSFLLLGLVGCIVGAVKLRKKFFGSK